MDINDSKKPIKLNENDSIDVNNLITLADSDITDDLLKQLEENALKEQEKIDSEDKNKSINIDSVFKSNIDSESDNLKQPDIELPQGLPAGEGAVNISGDILEKNKDADIDINEDNAVSTPSQETLNLIEEAKLNANYKKYVIYINKENEKFIDSLTILERKRLINDVLSEQNKLTKEQIAERKRVERTIKTAIALVVFVIAIPIFYFLFNICMEATIQNYRHSKSNFEVLYKETGKIKINK